MRWGPTKALLKKFHFLAIPLITLLAGCSGDGYLEANKEISQFERPEFNIRGHLLLSSEHEYDANYEDEYSGFSIYTHFIPGNIHSRNLKLIESMQHASSLLPAGQIHVKRKYYNLILMPIDKNFADICFGEYLSYYLGEMDIGNNYAESRLTVFDNNRAFSLADKLGIDRSKRGPFLVFSNEPLFEKTYSRHHIPTFDLSEISESAFPVLSQRMIKYLNSPGKWEEDDLINWKVSTASALADANVTFEDSLLTAMRVVKFIRTASASASTAGQKNNSGRCSKLKQQLT
ncbi:hypothetical protein GCM10009100_04530 [Thalassospira tepidiphila]